MQLSQIALSAAIIAIALNRRATLIIIFCVFSECTVGELRNEELTMAEIKVDFSKKTGKIKPVNGVGQPPFRGIDFGMVKYLKEAAIPFSRLHDVGGDFGGNIFVDIPNVFRDFDADPYDPDAYDFAFTDLLINALVENGVEPFYRLGVTIENYSCVKAYRIYPPADNEKWARICEGVISHYTEGWANGYKYNIRYWEIWNEPDNWQEIEKNEMWRGTMEEYFELYKTASVYLKKRFPNLKIGGYGSCGFYAIDEFGAISAANSTDRSEYFIEFFEKFLAFAKENNCPLDFFSWHTYAPVDRSVAFAKYARNMLDKFGLKETETTCNEWNPQVELRGTARHAALVTAMLLGFQNSPLDSAMFYDARLGISVYGSLFDPLTGKPYPAYYGFKAFGELYQNKTQVSAEVFGDELYAVAADGDFGGKLLVSNISEIAQPLEILSNRKISSCRIIDDFKMLENCDFNGEITGNSIMIFDF